MARFKRLGSEYTIVVPYGDSWQWMLTTEYAIEKKEQGFDVEIIAIEVLNLSGLYHKFLRMLSVGDLNNNLFKNIRNREIKISFISVWPRLSLKSVILDADHNYSRNDFFQRIAYPHLIDQLKSMRIRPKEDRVRIIKLVRQAEAVTRVLQKISTSDVREISTPSGRYCRNKAVTEFFKGADIPFIKVLETGSHGHYEVLHNAHSVAEFAELVEKYWLESSQINRKDIGKSFFEERLAQAGSAADLWTHSMVPGRLPELDKTKKLCVFYTTTQIEFEGMGDPPAYDEFSDQVDAIKCLRAKLPVEEWELVVRRHPRHKDVNHLELDLMQGLEEISNLEIIDGNSSVDSYSLGKSADLIVHFGSTIGAEFTYLGKVPVYALKRTYWWKFAKEHHLITKTMLRELDLEQLSIADPDSPLPWGYYLKKGGIPFRHIREVKGLWTLDGKTIRRRE